MTVIADWTRGGAGIAYQTCASCNAVWYFQRGFCPACGNSNPVARQASGAGTVHARTSVARAPTEELRAHAPYLIVLVDADEGFRLMAHGESTLEIGDRVQARFVDLGDKKIPYFEPADGRQKSVDAEGAEEKKKRDRGGNMIEGEYRARNGICGSIREPR